jgi:hypothetical protein
MEKPRRAVIPTVMWPPLIGRYATNGSPVGRADATVVAPGAAVVTSIELKLSVVTPAINGWLGSKVWAVYSDESALVG